MIGFWLFGDVSKLIFYLAKKQPWQFVGCAIIQISVEAGILMQFRQYGIRGRKDVNATAPGEIIRDDHRSSSS